MSSGRVQCKDIDDELFLQAVINVMRPHGTAIVWDLEEELPKVLGWESIPDHLILAKAKKLIAAGKLDGCACGCRGDFSLK